MEVKSGTERKLNYLRDNGFEKRTFVFTYYVRSLKLTYVKCNQQKDSNLFSNENAAMPLSKLFKRTKRLAASRIIIIYFLFIGVNFSSRS